jgi:hypothetical protein
MWKTQGFDLHLVGLPNGGRIFDLRASVDEVPTTPVPFRPPVSGMSASVRGINFFGAHGNPSSQMVVQWQPAVRLGGPQPVNDHFFTAGHLDGMCLRSGVALFGVRRAGAEAYADPTAARKFTLDDELFVIANINDLTTRTDLIATPLTKIDAFLELRDHRAANPYAGNLAVVPKFEVGAR